MSTTNTTQPIDHRRALLTAVFVTVLWASSWVLIRWGLDDENLKPLGFAALRYAVAAGVLLGLVFSTPARRAEVRSLDQGSWMRLIIYGLIFVTVTQGAMFVAIDSQPAATTSLILSMTPLIVASISTVTVGEKPTSKQLAGAGIIALGAVAYFSGSLGFTAAGLIAALVALGSNTGSALLGRVVNRDLKVRPLTVTVVSMGVGALALLAVSLLVEGVPQITIRAGLIILWLALVNTALAFTLWNRTLQQLTAAESAAINNTMLIQIGLLAWWFLGETPGVPDLVGMIAVTIGVMLAQRTKQKDG